MGLNFVEKDADPLFWLYGKEMGDGAFFLGLSVIWVYPGQNPKPKPTWLRLGYYYRTATNWFVASLLQLTTW